MSMRSFSAYLKLVNSCGLYDEARARFQRVAYLVARKHVTALSVAMIYASILLVILRNLHRARHHGRQMVVSEMNEESVTVLSGSPRGSLKKGSRSIK